jgi:hypothetical protein
MPQRLPGGAAFSLCALLCIGSCSRQGKALHQEPPPKNDTSLSSGPTVDQATAKEKLRLALESWQFGDNERSLKKAHPEIDSFSNLGAITDYMPYTPKLQRFEITSGRRTTNANFPTLIVYEFNVIHTFERNTGAEKKSHVYEVYTDKGEKWSINAKLK